MYSHAKIDKTLDTESFYAISKLAYQESGLQLVEEKLSMIQSRLRHRLVAVGLDSFQHYADFVCSKAGVEERVQMISALTTNVSHFYRESHHFDILNQEFLKGKLENSRNGQRFRIWSAGCSNGQEAFTIIMSVLEAFPQVLDMDFKVLATDIDPQVVSFGARATYPERLTAGIPKSLLSKYFIPVQTDEGCGYQANDTLLNRVYFRELNLLSDWPMRGKMDAIFCRNVVIYFDQQTQNKLWPRFRQHLNCGGYLFLGHSERISDPAANDFSAQGPTTYRAFSS